MHFKKILIYDDVQSFAGEFKEMLNQLLPQAEIITANTQEEAYANLDKCDLLMLDIELENNQNGIDFFKNLKQYKDPHLPIVFISGYIHNVERIFDVESDGYLMKPITMNRLKLCLRRLSDRLNKRTMLIPVKNGVEAISVDQILFIENYMRHSKYYKTDGTEVISISGFSDSGKMLPECFCRCHMSFYVNLHHATALHRYEFTLDNGKTVPVSQSRYVKSKEFYERFVGMML